MVRTLGFKWFEISEVQTKCEMTLDLPRCLSGFLVFSVGIETTQEDVF